MLQVNTNVCHKFSRGENVCPKYVIYMNLFFFVTNTYQYNTFIN